MSGEDFNKIENISDPKQENENINRQPELPDELAQIFEDQEIPSDKKQKIIHAFTSYQVRFSGPLPPPELLDGYNQAIPDGANRILIMAENQSKHRMNIEELAIQSQLRQSGRGQWMGFFIAILIIISSCLLAYLGHEWLAGTMVTTTVISLATIFVLGKKAQVKDLQTKAPK